MITLTFETVDETGQERSGAHNHEVEIELEQNCYGGLCEPYNYSNRWKHSLNVDADCPVCHGTGFIPSANGLKVIEFLKKYNAVSM